MPRSRYSQSLLARWRNELFSGLDGTFYELDRSRSEREVDSSFSAEQICNDRKSRAFYIAKKECFSLLVDDPPMDLGQLQVRIDLRGNFNELVFFSERVEERSEVAVHCLYSSKSRN